MRPPPKSLRPPRGFPSRWLLLRHPLFLGAAGLFWIEWGLSRAGIHVPYAHAYLADLLCLPVVLTLVLAFRRYVVFRHPAHCLSAGQITFAIIYCSLFFEVWMPRFSERYTGDWRDVLAYALGGLAFAHWLNRPEPATPDNASGVGQMLRE